MKLWIGSRNSCSRFILLCIAQGSVRGNVGAESRQSQSPEGHESDHLSGYPHRFFAVHHSAACRTPAPATFARPFFGLAEAGAASRFNGRRASVSRKNRPVWLASLRAMSSGVPWATISPPPSPPSGPNVDHPVGGPDDSTAVTPPAAAVRTPLPPCRHPQCRRGGGQGGHGRAYAYPRASRTEIILHRSRVRPSPPRLRTGLRGPTQGTAASSWADTVTQS